jgi:hypothetical protein
MDLLCDQELKGILFYEESENSYEESENPINDEGKNQTNFKFIVAILKIVINKGFHLFYLL